MAVAVLLGVEGSVKIGVGELVARVALVALCSIVVICRRAMC